MATAAISGVAMRRWLKRLKAAVTLGGLWGASAGAVAATTAALVQLVGGSFVIDAVVRVGLQYGVVGWLVGTAFAGTLIHFEAKGLLGRMRSWRIGLWGALMGGVLGVLLSDSVAAGSLPALAGMAGLGAGLGSLLSLSTHQLAESVSRELAADLAKPQLGSVRTDDRAIPDR